LRIGAGARSKGVVRTLSAFEVREVSEAGLCCRTWSNHWGGGQRGCFRVSRDGDTLVFDHVCCSSGNADRYTYRLFPGNP
jgi:hypothetical protein